MKFTVEGTTYEMVQSKVTFAEARAIERVTGHTFTEINNDPAVRGSTDVIQAMCWISMKRTDPTLVFSDLDDVDMLGIVWDAEESEESADPTQVAPSSPDDAESEPDLTLPAPA